MMVWCSCALHFCLSLSLDSSPTANSLESSRQLQSEWQHNDKYRSVWCSSYRSMRHSDGGATHRVSCSRSGDDNPQGFATVVLVSDGALATDEGARSSSLNERRDS
ncbi:hypothetical protein VIGAN_07185400 [Vigna angularis var. angularis]|uniref:Uncharacterized protein n=1 Tax=Vigna angularis var. angularis TaxID=157739 RepID=A0A0S3SJK4_PHAAN|nr:hypothetical protein VIGAN_07185400 [Vigna angularis var. angularis]